MVEVIVTETISVPNNPQGLQRSIKTEYTIGETRSYSVKISNEAMGMPSLVGGALSLAAKTSAAKIVANVVAAKLGANFIPGLNLVSWILSAAAMVNALTGKAGIEITISMEYTETYWHREGIYTYGWNARGLSLSRY